jgi:hypothetical protein
MKRIVLVLLLLTLPSISAAHTIQQDGNILIHSNENVLTGEDAKVINSYEDDKSQSIVLLYDNGMVVIFNKLSGDLIGVNPATSKILVQKKNGQIILKNER